MQTAAGNGTFLPLRLTYGILPIVAGLDKFTNLLTDWEAYLHPALSDLLPFSAGALMRTLGVVEIVVGILVLTRFTRIGAYAAAAWLTLIAAQLLALGVVDVAVRDLAMAVGAWTLARVAEARDGVTVRDSSIDSGGALERAEAR